MNIYRFTLLTLLGIALVGCETTPTQLDQQKLDNVLSQQYHFQTRPATFVMPESYYVCGNTVYPCIAPSSLYPMIEAPQNNYHSSVPKKLVRKPHHHHLLKRKVVCKESA